MTTKTNQSPSLEDAAGLLFDSICADGALGLAVRSAVVVMDLGENLVTRIDRPFAGEIGTYRFSERRAFLPLDRFPAMRPSSHACAGVPNHPAAPSAAGCNGGIAA